MTGPYRVRPPDGPEPLGPPARQWTPRGGHGYTPPRRPHRRHGAAATVVGALGGLAALCVVAIVGYSLAGPASWNAPATSGPRTHAGSRTAAMDGPLYRSGALSAVPCRLPAIREHDEHSMLAFLDTLAGCLDRTWRRQFAKAHVSGFSAPERVFWSTPGKSPCGSYPAPGAAAFYCPVNDAMYVGLRDVITTSGDEPVWHYAVYARVIAHEYGHHVQEDAGILGYGHRLMATGPAAGRSEASRRIELQAQCFAGAFLGAERDTLPMSPVQYRAVMADARARGEDRTPPGRRDHGSGRHYADWVARGYARRVLSACDTWTAPSPDVS